MMLLIKRSKILSLVLLLLISFVFCFQTTVLAVNSSFNSKIEAMAFYRWMTSLCHYKTGLPASHIGDPRFREWTMTYDAAVCALAFLAMGDVKRARNILDFYIKSREVHRLGGVIEAVLNFSKEGQGIQWQVRTGSNLWLGIAAFHTYLATQDRKYLKLARQQADLLLKLQDRDLSSDTYGAISSGPKGVPYNIKDQHVDWDEHKPEYSELYSTEVNINAWALLRLLSSKVKDPRYIESRQLILNWLREKAFNSKEKRFNKGYYQRFDTRFSPNTHFWGVSALGTKRFNLFGKEAAKNLMLYAEKNAEGVAKYKKINGEMVTIRGYDFIAKNDRVRRRREFVVSPAETLQSVLAFSLLADEARDPKLKKYYLKRRNKFLMNILKMANRKNKMASLPYASKGGVPIGHEYSTPEEGTQSVIGAACAILALMDYDPLNLPKTNKWYSKQ